MSEGYFSDYRWTCPRGHWIPAASVVSEDYLDNGAYYGVSTHTTGTCKRCGPVDEPRYVPMRWIEPAPAVRLWNGDPR
jgi:hypothetical protein